MEYESFEDNEVAKILKDNFIAIKVDKEERPDIDSIYMNVCQMYTGSGGWPLSVIMNPEQKPIFVGTYLPKNTRYHSVGFVELLLNIKEKWKNDREKLIEVGDKAVNHLNKKVRNEHAGSPEDLINNAINIFKSSFDAEYGGFGSAPKFPMPHNIIFLLNNYEITKEAYTLYMVEKTLTQMYKGGIFDHIGFGFSRYSTDKFWLAPHFEKMLYDNALLIVAYLEAYRIIGNDLYKAVAVKTMDYVLRELTSEDGGFYCAQDADSDGVEGKYYVFSPDEIIRLLGKDEGEYFNKYFDITQKGNFESKNIPNLINTVEFDKSVEKLLPVVYDYRKNRTSLHKDDKILTSWNSLMIVAFVKAYKTLGNKKYLDIAKKADCFIENNLCDRKEIFTSFRDGRKSKYGFLDDYSFYLFAQIELYEATYERAYLDKAVRLNSTIMSKFYDDENGGFYLYSKDSEQLIMRPKETYDGAIPAGNSFMAYNLIKLGRLTKDIGLEQAAQTQIDFMASFAAKYPVGYSFFMISLQMFLYHSKVIICVLKNTANKEELRTKLPPNAAIVFLDNESEEYPAKDGKTTFYMCEKNSCLPPTNEISDLF